MSRDDPGIPLGSKPSIPGHLFLCGALLSLFCIPCYAGFAVQRLVQIPAEPWQQVTSLQTDSQGNLIVSAIVNPQGSSDPTISFGVVKKVSPAGTELFRVVLPGVIDSKMPLAIDGNNDIYVAGRTLAPAAFPFTHVLTTSPQSEGAFVVKVHGQDGTIAYATKWGYGNPDSIFVDLSGQVLVTASMFSPLLAPTTGAYASPPGGNLTTEMYLARLSAAGDSILFVARYGGQTSVCTTGSSCSGAAQVTQGSQIMMDAQGNIWIAGTTNTTDLPLTANALKKTCGCSQSSGDGFLAEFTGDGSRLLYATYIGTTPPNQLENAGDDAISVAVTDSAGHIWMAGTTNGSDFPVTANAVQKQLAGGIDGFLAEYDPATNKLLYATYFGGTGDDSISNIQIGADGTVIVAGQSSSTVLPVAATGFMRGNEFVTTLDSHSYLFNALTMFPNGSTGSGLALAPGGSFVISGASNVAAYVETGGSSSPSVYAVVGGAGTAVTGQIAPGELVSLYGANIGPAMPATADLRSGQAPTQLGGVQVLVDGTPAPLLYAQSDQINAIVPFGLANPTTHIVVSNGGAKSNEAILGVVMAQPDAFKLNARLWAATLNQDGSINSAGNHAKLGSIVSVFATGFGVMTPQPPDGQLITGTLPKLAAPVHVLYQGQPLEVTYAGPAPTLVAGVMQVNFRLPAFTGTSEPAFQFVVGGWPSGSFLVLVK
jgi:uncharacterized protein (TIGR03437 family)